MDSSPYGEEKSTLRRSSSSFWSILLWRASRLECFSNRIIWNICHSIKHRSIAPGIIHFESWLRWLEAMINYCRTMFFFNKCLILLCKRVVRKNKINRLSEDSCRWVFWLFLLDHYDFHQDSNDYIYIGVMFGNHLFIKVQRIRSMKKEYSIFQLSSRRITPLRLFCLGSPPRSSTPTLISMATFASIFSEINGHLVWLWLQLSSASCPSYQTPALTFTSTSKPDSPCEPPQKHTRRQFTSGPSSTQVPNDFLILNKGTKFQGILFQSFKK